MKTPLTTFSLCISLTIVSNLTAATTARFYELGSDRNYSEPTAISANGSVVVGYAEDQDGVGHPFRQIRRGQMELFPEVTHFLAIGVSANGKTVVGNFDGTDGYNHGFLWSQKSGAIDLSDGPGRVFSAIGISGNGKKVFGYLQDLENFEPSFIPDQPCVWSAKDGLQLLDNPFLESSYPSAASYDGDVVVSGIQMGTHNYHACRWTKGKAIELLPDLGIESYANGVSADGRVAVGYSRGSDDILRAVRWTDKSGMQLLERNPDTILSGALGSSDDGSRIVGVIWTTSNVESGFLWTSTGGLQNMDQLFESALPPGWRFVTAAAISSDGKWIVGTALSPDTGLRGYILDTGLKRGRSADND